jgi:hypothetical protein
LGKEAAPVPAIVLIPSSLVGPATWTPVAEELRRRQVETVVPALDDDGGRGLPFWRQHVDAVIRAVAPISPETPLALVGHSGAGPLLPAIGQELWQPVAAYIFVDAGIPTDGKSRVELMEGEDPPFARHLWQHLVAGGRFPEWTTEDLTSIVPNAGVRRQLLAEMHPRSLAYFAEAIPVFAGWPDAPCGFVQFSPAYDVPARRAREAGWRYVEIAAGHFHMLVDPPAVAGAILDLIDRLPAKRMHASPSPGGR